MSIRSWFTKKKIIWGIIILVVLGLILRATVFKKADTSKILTDTVKRQDLKQTVLATGQVTSTTDLDLAFKGTGIVQRINVKVGDKVTEGQVLANLSQSDAAASLTSARGALASAQANYDKVVAGASSEEVAVAQVTLDNAKKTLSDTRAQQATAVANAYNALLNSTPAASPRVSNTGTAPTISGSYTGTQTGSYFISFSGGGSGLVYTVTGLESNTGNVVSGGIVPLGTKGLFMQFSSATNISDAWEVAIPNTKAATYTTNLNAYNAAIQAQSAAISAAQSAVDSAQATLTLKQAQARPADLEAARAAVLSAQGQVQSAQSLFENTIVRAPSSGTITSVDIKVGEQAQALKEVIVLQDVDNLHIEANVSEANIAQVSVGQSVSYTFDALGPDRQFSGQVQAIDPASTVVSGVVNYKVTASVDKLSEIKPGMTGNMTILTAEKKAVLAVPSRSVLAHDGKKFVRVIDDPKKKTYHEVEVTTGLEADGGLIEISSGLSQDQGIVSFINP